jgi:dTDP-4-dehydrorhamnose 3,5-epimerase
MIFKELPLKGAFLIQLKVLGDERGWFSRTYCKDSFAEHSLFQEWVQMNQSFTSKEGTIRGMHFQYPPHEEIKLVRCISGAVNDVIIDLRKNSSSFLKYTSVELSEKNHQMIYIPIGFAHGFQTLEKNTSLLYHHSTNYFQNAEGGIRYNDPLINIDWKYPPSELSKRDAELPFIDLNKFYGI